MPFFLNCQKKPGERRLAIELAGGLHVASWKDWVDSEVAWQEVNAHQEEQASPSTCALQYPLADADADADGPWQIRPLVSNLANWALHFRGPWQI